MENSSQVGGKKVERRWTTSLLEPQGANLHKLSRSLEWSYGSQSFKVVLPQVLKNKTKKSTKCDSPHVVPIAKRAFWEGGHWKDEGGKNGGLRVRRGGGWEAEGGCAK